MPQALPRGPDSKLPEGRAAGKRQRAAPGTPASSGSSPRRCPRPWPPSVLAKCLSSSARQFIGTHDDKALTMTTQTATPLLTFWPPPELPPVSALLLPQPGSLHGPVTLWAGPPRAPGHTQTGSTTTVAPNHTTTDALSRHGAPSHVSMAVSLGSHNPARAINSNHWSPSRDARARGLPPCSTVYLCLGVT